MFIGERWLVTVHRGAGDLIDRRALTGGTRPASSARTASAFAMYALLDVVVDGYFDTIDRFEAFYDDAADRVFGE